MSEVRCTILMGARVLLDARRMECGELSDSATGRAICGNRSIASLFKDGDLQAVIDARQMPLEICAEAKHTLKVRFEEGAPTGANMLIADAKGVSVDIFEKTINDALRG